MKNTFNVASCVDRLPWQDYKGHCGVIYDWGYDNAMSVEECPPIVYHFKCDDKIGDVVAKWMMGSNTEKVKICKDSMGNELNLPLKNYCKKSCGQCGMLFYIKII